MTSFIASRLMIFSQRKWITWYLCCRVSIAHLTRQFCIITIWIEWSNIVQWNKAKIEMANDKMSFHRVQIEMDSKWKLLFCVSFYCSSLRPLSFSLKWISAMTANKVCIGSFTGDNKHFQIFIIIFSFILLVVSLSSILWIFRWIVIILAMR